MPGVIQPGIVGTVQDIADSVFLFQAEDHPFLAALKKGPPPRQEIHQFQMGKRNNVDKRGVRDGKDVDRFRESEERGILETNSHWIREQYFVGKKAQTFTDVAGRKDLLQNEIMNTITMVKTGISEVMLDDEDQRDEATNDLGSETRGFGSWISSTAQSVRPVPEKFLTPAAQIYTGAFADITEKTFKNILASLWKTSRSRKRYVAWCGIDLKGLVSDWSIHIPNQTSQTAVRSFDQNADARSLVAVINVLECDGGTIEMHLEPNLRKSRDGGGDMTTASNRSAFIMDMDSCESMWAQKPQRGRLPDGGGGQRGYVDAIFATKCFPTNHGKIVPGS